MFSAFVCFTHLLVLAMVIALSSSSSNPQTAPAPSESPLPGTADPSRIDREVRPSPLPPSGGEIQIPPPTENAKPPADADQQRFRLSKVQINGSTAYSEAQLATTYQEFLGKEISIREIYTIRERVTTLYNQDDYVLTRVIIPEQTVRGGVIQLRVVEGVIERVVFEGAPSNLLSRIQGFGDKLTASRPLKRQDLERYLLLAYDLAGIEGRAVLSPGSKPGATVLNVNLTYRPFQGAALLNNRGTSTIGPLRLQGLASLNSLILGSGERLILSGATTPEDFSQLANLGFNFSLPVDYEGLTFNALGSYTGVRVGGNLRRFNISGENFFGSIGVSYPLVRSRQSNFYINSEFNYINSYTTVNLTGSPAILSFDRLRVLRIGLNFDSIDPGGNLQGQIRLSQGIGGLGASSSEAGQPPQSRAAGQAGFTKLTLDLTRQQLLPEQFVLEISGTAQITGTSLLAAEQFGLGGARFGRAFESSQLLGDSGYGLRLELRRPFVYRIDNQLASSEPYVFLDYGQVFRQVPTALEASSSELSSTGLGIRQNFDRWLALQLELAIPLSYPRSISDPGSRVFFGVTARF